MNAKLSIIISFFSLFTWYSSVSCANQPRLTLIVVVDQLAYHEIQKLQSHFTGGFKTMLNNGIRYEKAFFPHATPQTAPGHATISTGCLPKDHGIVSNAWVKPNGKKTTSDQDKSSISAVFSPDGVYDYGRSAHNLMVDALSDQMVFASQPGKTRQAIAISHKSRAAIALAGKLGKAFWLDVATGHFTSSKAYFDSLPNWAITFNATKKIDTIHSTFWELAYPKNKSAYAYTNINNYSHAGAWGFDQGLIHLAGKKITLDTPIEASGIDDKGPYELYAKTPAGNQLLLDFGKACIDEYLGKQKIDHLLLWVSCSGLDKIGHPFGPQSLEAVDITYHIDKQLNDFMLYAQKKIGSTNVLFVLTSDHGIVPIPENMKQAGYRSAYRIYVPKLVQTMNATIAHKYGIEKFIIDFKNNQFYFDQKIVRSLSKEQRCSIIKDLKKVLRDQPGIKKVWTYKELASAPYQLAGHEIEAYYKNQIFKGRSGDLICQSYPYSLFTDRAEGTTHTSPYAYDTQVPLIIYQKGIFQHKQITQKIWMPQLTVTLAYILGIQQPSASTFDLLPGIDLTKIPNTKNNKMY